MKSIVNQLEALADSDLFAISEAIDIEMQRREKIAGDVPDSARRRAKARGESYRRNTGAQATPIRIIGIGKANSDRRAA